MKYKESTILITGAGTGMGLEAAKWFSAQGSRVVILRYLRSPEEALLMVNQATGA